MASERDTVSEQPPPEVWLVRETDHLRAGQQLIAIFAGGAATLFEHGGVQPARPVDAVLALAGFKGGEAATLAVRTVKAADVHVEKVRGFPVSEGALGGVEMEIRKVLGGLAGGYLPLHMQQVGFGCGVNAQIAFDRAWDAAGRPALLVRSAGFAPDTGGQLMDIHGSALSNPSMLATRFRHDDGVTDDEGNPVKSGAKKDQALGAEVVDRVVPGSRPCPFCSRPMVKKNGAYFCVQTLAEQSAASAPRG